MKLRSLLATGLLAITVLSACDSGATATPSTGGGASATDTPAATAATPTTATSAAATPTEAAMAGETPTGGTSTSGNANYPGANATLNGAGATFPLPLISKWAQTYDNQFSGMKINYQGIGSGGGINQITNKTVDFAATDSPMKDDQLQKAGGPDAILHIPWVMGGVVIAYNLKDVTTQLKMDGPTLAKIYLLQIKTWNDPAIAALNTGVTLPNTPIAVVHRSEGSGTTDIFTDYLSKESPDFKSKVGRGTSVQWPGGIGAQGNDGVTNLVKQTVGAIGYIELSYAKKNNVPYALMKNKAGNFVDSTSDNVSAAANAVVDSGSLPADLRYSITDTDCATCYPIAGTDWALAYVNQSDATKGKATAYFIWWAIHEGQQYSNDLFYAPIPQSLVQRDEAQVKKLLCGGSPCFP